MLLSVIVPAYNVEKYINKCIESLIVQQNIEFEIIIVNDGSTDKTLKKIREIEKKYPDQIKVINQENRGLGGARNTGIECAKGKYITFVDSDDYIIKNSFSKLFNLIGNIEFDIACYRHMEFEEGTSINENNIKKSYNNKVEILSNIQAQKKFFNGYITSYAWDKIYNANIFKNNNIKFTEKTYYEDLRVAYEAIANSDKIIDINYCGYLYLQRNNSITKTFTQKHLDDFIFEYGQLLNKISRDTSEKCVKEIKNYKILKKNSITRNIVGLENYKYKLSSKFDVKSNFFEIITNKDLNRKEKMVFIIGNNRRLFKFLKKFRKSDGVD